MLKPLARDTVNVTDPHTGYKTGGACEAGQSEAATETQRGGHMGTRRAGGQRDNNQCASPAHT